MAVKRVSKKSNKRGRGRPIEYPLTSNEVRRVTAMFGKGISANAIIEATGYAPTAVLRVQRSLR